MKIFLRSLLVLFVCVSAAHAQNTPPTAPRAFTMPDSLGANVAVGDSATATSGATDYDFLVGIWQFTFQSRRPNGTFTPTFNGHWFVERKKVSPTSALIVDHWRADDPNSPYDAGTWTYRWFNPTSKRWEMRATDGRSGWFTGAMWNDGADRVLIEHYSPTFMVRYRYFAIEPNKFMWRADLSNDNGKTWLLDGWTMIAKRVAQ